MNNSSISKYTKPLGLLANVGFVGVIMLALWGSLSAQFMFNEMPCPLCMLQKYGMIFAAMGPIYILVSRQRNELTYRKYMTGMGISLVSSFFGAVYSARQMIFHFSDEGYGAAFFGLHFYTWSFIMFAAIILYCGVMLAFQDNFMPSNEKYSSLIENGIQLVLIIFFITMVVVFLSVTFELGFNFILPDDPTQYNMFHQFFQYQ